ncbi:MAG: HEPN domain-containing protein [Armatimonadota bacterium]
MNPYAVATRYPGESEPVTEDEYRDALRIAESIVSWAEDAVSNC